MQKSRSFFPRNKILARIRNKSSVVYVNQKKKAMTTQVLRKRNQKKFNLPVIGYFSDKNVRFNTILQAETVTGINYNLIFEACIGKIYRAGNVIWEFEKGNHFIRYKAYYLKAMQKIKELEDKE